MRQFLGWCINGLAVFAAVMSVFSLSVALGLEQAPWHALGYLGVSATALALSHLLAAASGADRWVGS